jgi:hypothetical protein
MCLARKQQLGTLCANLATESDLAKTGPGSQGVQLAVKMFCCERCLMKILFSGHASTLMSRVAMAWRVYSNIWHGKPPGLYLVQAQHALEHGYLLHNMVQYFA